MIVIYTVNFLFVILPLMDSKFCYVCLSVCLPTRISQKSHVRIFSNFLYVDDVHDQNKYDGPPQSGAEMYAGRVACCS